MNKNELKSAVMTKSRVKGFTMSLACLITLASINPYESKNVMAMEQIKISSVNTVEMEQFKISDISTIAMGQFKISAVNTIAMEQLKESARSGAVEVSRKSLLLENGGKSTLETVKVTKTPEEIDLDKLFADTLQSIKNVIEIANENNIRPFYFKCEWSLDPGHSEDVDIEKGLKAGLQVAINVARDNINKLPQSLNIHKSTFSSILDNYEYSILVTIDKILKDNEINPKQEKIILGRAIIKYLNDQYRGFYSEELDKLQNIILLEITSIIEKEEKDESDFIAAQELIETLKTIPYEFLTKDIMNFILHAEVKLNNEKNKDVIEKLINMEKINLNPDNLEIELPIPVPENYDLYINFKWIKDISKKKITAEDLESSYIYTKLEGDNVTTNVKLPVFFNEKDKSYLPAQGDYLIYLVNKQTKEVDYIGKNPIRLDLGVKSLNVNSSFENDGQVKTTLKITSPAKYTGYITHEIVTKNKNSQINYNILVNEGDSPEVIIKKIYERLSKISETYMPNIVVDLKDGILTIQSLDSMTISNRIQ